MVKCDECNKIYRGGRGWKISRGRFSVYASCPEHSKDNPQKEPFLDIRINRG